jgi:hypothetical protein
MEIDIICQLFETFELLALTLLLILAVTLLLIYREGEDKDEELKCRVTRKSHIKIIVSILQKARM